MTKLKDVLGAIQNDLVIAQSKGDIATKQLAASYYYHPILKHFDVPRINVKSAKLKINFALDKNVKCRDRHHDHCDGDNQHHELLNHKVVLDRHRLEDMSEHLINYIELELDTDYLTPSEFELYEKDNELVEQKDDLDV